MGEQPIPMQRAPSRNRADTALEHAYRRDAGAVTAALARLFGPGNLDLIETAQQDALLRALAVWREGGIPDNPTAWLIKVARNRAIDIIRQNRLHGERHAELVVAPRLPEPDWDDGVTLRSELDDDQLRMMFVCCDPALSIEAQIVLTLKTLCGMQVAEIARALLTAEPTIAKRLTRAKQALRAAHIGFELPAQDALAARLDTVLMVLYLLFNEGYSAHKGERPVRRELCEEAIRLASLLAQHPLTDRPRVHALLALVLLHGSRLAARLEGNSESATLAEQDRALWDRDSIHRGLVCLAKSADGEDVTRFHLEAGIAACHAVAPTYEQTDWQRIVGLYDQLLTLNPSPVVTLNRAIAVGMHAGPAAGLAELEKIADHPKLKGYFLLPAAFGELHARLDRPREAARYLRQAYDLAASAADRRFLAKRLAALTD